MMYSTDEFYQAWELDRARRDEEWAARRFRRRLRRRIRRRYGCTGAQLRLVKNRGLGLRSRSSNSLIIFGVPYSHSGLDNPKGCRQTLCDLPHSTWLRFAVDARTAVLVAFLLVLLAPHGAGMVSNG